MSNGPSGIHAEIDQARKTSISHPEQVKVFREYSRGRQRSTLTTGQTKILRGLLGALFSDNICKMVLSQVGNRVQLTRYEVGGEGAQADAVLSFLSRLWTLNQLPAFSTAVHWAALRDGNHAVMESWVDGRVLLTRERWWNGADGIFVQYDDLDRPQYAVKEWKDTSGTFRTVYRPHQIERYKQDSAQGAPGNGWRLFNRQGDGADELLPTAVPWTMNGQKDGEPLGLPVVHFANLQVPNDADGDETDRGDPQYGMSELDGGLIGLQDEINDVHRDISAAARFAGYQMYYGTGLTRRTDDDGKELHFSVEPGAFLEEENENATFGALPAGSLAELERTLSVKLQAVSRASSVPMHLIAGEWPSGEALLRAERPLTDKAETLGRFFGPAWASVGHKATRIANAFAGPALQRDYRVGQLDDRLLIAAIFASAERRDPITRAQIAASEAPFVSEEETLRTLGKSPEDQKRILAERQDARERNARAALPASEAQS